MWLFGIVIISIVAIITVDFCCITIKDSSLSDEEQSRWVAEWNAIKQKQNNGKDRR